MIKILRSAAALGLGLTLMATAASAAAYRIHLNGLACPFCAYGVEKKLGEIKGVDRLQTNIKTGMVTIIMKDGATLDRATAAKAVRDAGFQLDRFE